MDAVLVKIDPEIMKKELVALEYPEFIEKDQEFTEKIQIAEEPNKGPKFVYKPFSEGSNRLEISSNSQNRNLIVLKIKKNSNSSIQDANLVGILNKCHVFRDLFDFVTESELENTLQNELKSTADDFDESKIETISNIISQSKIDWNKFSIPPYKFSHINLPLSFRDIRLNLKVSQKDESSNQERSWNISFNEPEVPSNPTDDCISRAKNIPREYIEAVAKIFNERPIVSKTYLQHKINDVSIIANLRQILPLLAYHWKNGPWHLLWTKYGVDPRKHSRYRFYQSIELRNKMFAKELKRGKSAASGSSTINSNPLASSNSFCFDGENLILNYLTYQYIDLTYAPLQQIVNYPADIKSKVSENEGWYPDGTAKNLREIMKQRWFELLKGMDLSSFPQNKLEEILDLTSPAVSGSVIGADWNSLSKVYETQNSYSESDEEIELNEEENSDYEIFDY